MEYHLFSGSQTILPTHNPRVQAKFRRVLIARSVHLHEGCQVVDVDKHGLRCDNGLYYPLNEILWVTDATAPAWLMKPGDLLILTKPIGTGLCFRPICDSGPNDVGLTLHSTQCCNPIGLGLVLHSPQSNRLH